MLSNHAQVNMITYQISVTSTYIQIHILVTASIFLINQRIMWHYFLFQPKVTNNNNIDVAYFSAEIFDNYMQQDAHEFLNYLLNTVADILQGEVTDLHLLFVCYEKC